MKLLSSIVLVFIFPLFVFAQDGKPSPKAQKDFQLWLDAGVNYKLVKKLNLKFEAAYRRDNNLADVNENYAELQLQYKAFKFLTFSGGYRLSGWFEKYLVNRLFVYARFKFDVERLRFQYRFRYDYNFNSSISFLPGHIRNKIKIKYRTRKFPLDPYVAYEFFFRTNEWDKRVTQQRFDLGLDYSISKKHKLRAYFRFQQRLNAYAPGKNYILGFSYAYDI
jgi:hypothetical protein